MSLNSFIRVRFAQDELDRAKKIADRTGLSLSDIVRHSVTDFIEKAEKTGTISFPMVRPFVIAEQVDDPAPVPLQAKPISYPKGPRAKPKK